MSHRFTWGETARIVDTADIVTIVATAENEYERSYDIRRVRDGAQFHISEDRLVKDYAAFGENVVHITRRH